MSYTTDFPVAPSGLGAPRGHQGPGERPTRWTRKTWFINLLAAAILLGIWQYLSSINERVPSVVLVGEFLGTEIAGNSHGGTSRGEFWSPLGISMQRYGIGLAIGIPTGAILGLLIGGSRRFRSVLNDTVLVLLALPSVVWAFAASLWFGFGSTAPIVAVVLTAVPFMAFNLSSGIRALDPGLTLMSNAFNVPRVRRASHLLIGGALPSAVTGIRLAFMTSWNSLLIVEWFGSSSGVGWRARFWYDALRFSGFVAWILLFVVLITLLDWLVLRRLERRSTRWQQQPTLTFAESEGT
ncbi:ABC transporter permease [Candidatus Poriferisodalis sp.]|uniref:ABC transporter permease n=1 Tax=Candidatus Poriferisodalis sp. TaxID=3101277 RepID=UPI003B02CA97